MQKELKLLLEELQVELEKRKGATKFKVVQKRWALFLYYLFINNCIMHRIESLEKKLSSKTEGKGYVVTYMLLYRLLH